MSEKPPFVRQEVVDKPGIVGAKWWHQTLADETAKLARRAVLKQIMVAGAFVAVGGGVIALAVDAEKSRPGEVPSDAKEERKATLDLQKDFGWSFGANEEALVFDGVSEKPFEGSLALLANALTPGRRDLTPYYVRTLFDAPYAMPSKLATLPEEESSTYKQLFTALKPIWTQAMATAYDKGKSLASLFEALPQPDAAKAAIVVDLAGPEAVAFAAGAANVFDPVFLFDNWPHPRGVVKSHETLAAAAYYQPLFDKARAAADAKKPPMFVLDRRRLTPYTDDATQFDNRWVAKMPTPASALTALGIQNVLYVVPSAAETTRESDDLNDDFLLYKTAGIDVRALGLDMFANPTFYGGSVATHHSFFTDYPWTKPPQPASPTPMANPGKTFTPSPRTTPYSTGIAGGTVNKPRPTTFGTTPVLVALGTGMILGARYSRSGSWNRASGGFWS